MKFISKNTNLHIILRPGQQAIPMTGTPAVPAISVRFQNGMADINDTNLVEMMQHHPGFNQDFIAADEIGTDPFVGQRTSQETQYVTSELKYGHVENRTVSQVAPKAYPPEIQNLINIEAQKMAMKIMREELPGLVTATIKSMGNGETTAAENDLTEEAAADLGSPATASSDVTVEEVVTPTPTTPNPRNRRSNVK